MGWRTKKTTKIYQNFKVGMVTKARFGSQEKYEKSQTEFGSFYVYFFIFAVEKQIKMYTYEKTISSFDSFIVLRFI